MEKICPKCGSNKINKEYEELYCLECGFCLYQFNSQFVTPAQVLANLGGTIVYALME